ncbi:MAG: hypothetical protein AAF602_33110 [Myxococcota bacterium]
MAETPTAATPPEATLDVRVGADIHPATLPRAPLRFLLHRAMQEALGLTAFDREQLRHLDADETLEPSNAPDPYALQCVYFAIVGACWGGANLPVPTLQAMRHDVVAYGEAVLEHFLVTTQDAALTKQLVAEGRKLHGLMMKDVTTQLTADLKVEQGFSKAQGEASTSG